MLLSLTRVGATLQGLDKAVAVLGADPARVTGQLTRTARSDELARRIEQVDAAPGLFVVRQEPAWLGTRPARDQAFDELARTLRLLADAARTAGGVLVPTAVGTNRQPAVLGGDTHVIEALSPVEQEVLTNLLRDQVPTLIAMAGRGVTTAGDPRDRIGSRWLTSSRAHLAARFFASTAPAHLERVKAELRRRDGVARLDRMDVVPGQSADGRLFVTVRCLDAAASLATARAHTIVLAAMGLRARRMVREGQRIGHSPQKRLEENRARAIADGLRARLVLEDRDGPPRRGQARTTRQVDGRTAVRELLLDLCREFANLGASADELAPVLLPVELPRLGLRRLATEHDLLSTWSERGESTLVNSAAGELGNPAAGGRLLGHARETAPGRVSVALDIWEANLSGGARTRKPKNDAPRHARDRARGSARRERDGRPEKPARRSRGDQRRGGSGGPGNNGRSSHD